MDTLNKGIDRVSLFQNKFKNLLLICSYILLFILAAVFSHKSMATFFLTGLFMVIFFARNQISNYLLQLKKYAALLVFMEYITAYFIGQYMKSGLFIIFILVSLLNMLLYSNLFNTIISIVLAIIIYVLGTAPLVKDLESIKFVVETLQGIGIIILVSIFAIVLNKVLKLSMENEKFIFETHLKAALLEKAYEELKIAYANLEELAIIKERNRIALEIHDSVGHALTAAYMQMEAGRILAAKDCMQAIEKYSTAQEQTKLAISKLRDSVKTLAEFNKDDDLPSLILQAINELRVQMGITVNYDIDPKSANVSYDIKNTVVKALKEGIVNGIKHGNANAFLFNLSRKNDHLIFFLQDNGSGCDTINKGLGLLAMQDRIEKIKGIINFSSTINEGFEIEFIVPID